MQKVGGPVVVWNRNINTEVVNAFKPKNLDVKFNVVMKLTLNKDILDALEPS